MMTTPRPPPPPAKNPCLAWPRASQTTSAVPLETAMTMMTKKQTRTMLSLMMSKMILTIRPLIPLCLIAPTFCLALNSTQREMPVSAQAISLRREASARLATASWLTPLRSETSASAQAIWLRMRMRAYLATAFYKAPV